MIIMIAYILTDMYTEVMVFTGLGGEAAVRKMLSDTKNETQEAIDAAMDQDGHADAVNASDKKAGISGGKKEAGR